MFMTAACVKKDQYQVASVHTAPKPAQSTHVLMQGIASCLHWLLRDMARMWTYSKRAAVGTC